MVVEWGKRLASRVIGQDVPSRPDSYYGSIADRGLRDYLEKFEEKVIKEQKIWPLRCEHIGYGDIPRRLGLQAPVVALLERRARHLGVIEPVRVSNVDISDFPFFSRKKVNCHNKDELRALAAICWKVRTCREEGRSLGWRELISEVKTDVGQHPINDFIHNLEDPTDLNDQELRSILKISKPSSDNPDSPIAAEVKEEIPRGYTSEYVEVEIDNLAEAKRKFLDLIKYLENDGRLFQKGAFVDWSQERLDELRDRIPTDLDEFSLARINLEDRGITEFIVRLIMFNHVASSIYGRGEAADLEVALKDLRNLDLNVGLRDVLSLMQGLDDGYKNLGSVTRLMIKKIKSEYKKDVLGGGMAR